MSECELNNGGLIKGIDISGYQDQSHLSTDDIDWAEVAASGVRFVIMKASEGTSSKNAEDVLATIGGVLEQDLDIGFYHFSTPDSPYDDDAVGEAMHFLQVLRNISKEYGIPASRYMIPWLDAEKDTARKISKKEKRHRLASWYHQWLVTVAQMMRTVPGLYGAPSWLTSRIGSGHGLGMYPLWVADRRWKTESPEKIRLPKGWDKAYIVQNSSDGKIPGIQGDVDVNYAFKDTYRSLFLGQ